jgi:hypothetical protein
MNNNQKATNELTTFIEKKLVTKQGIYTNFRATAQSKQVATGHELLSESSGLWLEHLVQTKQYEKFAIFYQATKKTFDQKQQFSYRYNLKSKKRYDVNATLDDLRILRALATFGTATKNQAALKEAAQRFTNLQQTVLKNGQLVDFYDVKAKQASTTSSLAYYDLKTLTYFESTSNQQRAFYQQQMQLVKNGYLGDAFPLYAKNYDFKTKKYSKEELNTSEALLVLEHLSEVNQLKKTSIQWLIQQVEAGKLYNRYSINGAILDPNTSPANYAIAALIFANLNDEVHYQQAMTFVWRDQVTDPKAAIFGGLGDAHTSDAYSFNNLVALLATER